MHLVVWENAAAGRGTAHEASARLVAEAERHGYDVERVAVDSPAVAADRARAALGDGADRLVAVGGDGTVHQALQVVAETGVAFGVVPVGSGNDFSAAMGLPRDVPQAVDRSLGPAERVDLLRIGGRYGATVATLGLSVDVTIRAERLRWPPGSAKYTVATLLEIPTMREHALRITVDGVPHDVRPNLVGVANTPTFGGGMRIAPDADARDGLLDVVLIGPSTRFAMLRLLPKAGSGGHVGHPDVQVLRGARIEIDAEQPVRVDADGECVGHTPLAIEARPGALLLAGARFDR